VILIARQRLPGFESLDCLFGVHQTASGGVTKVFDGFDFITRVQQLTDSVLKIGVRIIHTHRISFELSY
jgi:hypothetical protein